MKTIHLTPGQARHHFPGLFDHAVTRRGQGLPYSKEDAASFDEDLFVISGCVEFADIPFPVNVRIQGSEDDWAAIVNADSLPKQITASGLTLDNSTLDKNHIGWDASVIDTITCGSLRLVDPEKFPRYIQASDLVIERNEDASEHGTLDIGASQITLTDDDALIHLPLLRTLSELPEESVALLVIIIAGLELDEWAKLPSIRREWRGALNPDEMARIDAVVNRYEELRRPKRQLQDPPRQEPPEPMEVEVDLA